VGDVKICVGVGGTLGAVRLCVPWGVRVWSSCDVGLTSICLKSAALKSGIKNFIRPIPESSEKMLNFEGGGGRGGGGGGDHLSPKIQESPAPGRRTSALQGASCVEGCPPATRPILRKLGVCGELLSILLWGFWGKSLGLLALAFGAKR